MVCDNTPWMSRVPTDSAPPKTPSPPHVWRARATDAVDVTAVQKATGLPETIARVLVGRGVKDADSAEAYLRPTLKMLPDPSRLAGLDDAVDVLESAAVRGVPVGVFGDYDVDGVTSTTLLTDFLRQSGISATSTIPDRLIEGYGLSRAGVDRLYDAGCTVLVTVDCGVTNHDEILYAKSKGMDVVVVDHHTVPVELPKAAAVINPHRPDCTRGSEMLCAVGVTFNLAAALRRRLDERGWYSSTRIKPDLREALDLVALGTVADVVPLVGENRVLVHGGLKALRMGKRPGLKALLRVAGIEGKDVDAGDLGFQLGPRINAAGRLGDAMKGVQLLQSEAKDVEHLAGLLDAENLARRAIEKDIVAAAIKQVENSAALSAARAIVVGDESWHPGVVGIVASRLVDRFAKPAIVVGQGGRGSARSVEAFHMYDALRYVSTTLGPDVVAGFGGHAHAAGVRLTAGAQSFERFRDAMLAYAQARLTDEDLYRTSHHDGPIGKDMLRINAIRQLDVAAPFGRANPAPTFVVERARLRQLRVLKDEHLKGTIDPRTFGGGPGIDVIFFGGAARADECDGEVDLLVSPDINEFRGEQLVQMRVRDLRRSEARR